MQPPALLNAPRRAVSRRAGGIGVVVLLMLLAFGVGAIVVDQLYFAHGITVRFYAANGALRRGVARIDEHRIGYDNQHRPLSRYVQNWPAETLPIPTRIPPIDAEIDALLHVPPGPSQFIRAESDGRVVLSVDGQPVDQVPIAPGSHRLHAEWRGTFGRQTHLRFHAGPSLEPADPLPRSWLEPEHGSWTSTRILFWWVSAALAAFFAVLAAFAVAKPDARSKLAIFALGSMVVLLGAGLRTFDYDVMPEFRENPDELFAMWNGFSLLEDGTTRGWTMWPGAYQGLVDVERTEFWGIEEYVISPYFEHPPLLHLLTGAANHLGGTQQWQAVRLHDGRRVAIVLAVLSIVLTFALARKLDPVHPASAFWASLLYAVLPFIALQTRVIKEEVLVTPLMLGGLYAFVRWKETLYARRYLILAAVCMGLAPLTKVPAAALIIALGMLVAREGRVGDTILCGVIGFGLAALFALFGAVVDWAAFVVTQVQQGTRPMHFNVFARWFDDPLINHNLVGRGQLLFLWLAAVPALSARERSNGHVLVLPLVLYMLAITVGSGNWTFGWYETPLYPLLCIAAGQTSARAWNRPGLLFGLFFIGLLVFYGLNFTIDIGWAKQGPAWPVLRRVVSVLLALGLGPFCLVMVRDVEWTRRLCRVPLTVGWAAFVVLSTYFVVRYDHIADAYKNFDRDAYFDR